MIIIEIFLANTEISIDRQRRGEGRLPRIISSLGVNNPRDRGKSDRGAKPVLPDLSKRFKCNHRHVSDCQSKLGRLFHINKQPWQSEDPCRIRVAPLITRSHRARAGS